LSQNPNREIDLLKVNLAADYRLGSFVTMTGVYFGLIVALLVAWYQKFSSGDIFFYYTGVFLIGGVFGALLITQELLPYKNWFKQIDEWLRMIENNQRIPDVTKLVRLRDNLKSSRRLILIFLVVLDLYLTLLGYPSIWIFFGILSAGVVVVYLTRPRPT